MSDGFQGGSLSALGDYAFELADRLAADYGDDFRLGELILVAEVRLPDQSVAVEVLSSESRSYVAGAILNRALAIIEMREEAEMEPPEDGDA